jgi:signal transduction histidine kinase
VGNAVDAMRGGGRLRLRVSSGAAGGAVGPVHRGKGLSQLRLTIADTGSGIPKELLPTIFEPFVTTKGETGTGLGLWVTGEIAKKNGWSIQVRSRTESAARGFSSSAHSGTVFSIVIPRD